jgi:hypothetical protein
MSDRQVETEIAGLLEAARPELTRELEARAVAAVAAARPARSRRWIAVAVGAAVALFGLGFVPVPMGKAKGALDRAMAALEGTPGLYTRYHNYEQDKETVEEWWQSTGGLLRGDTWETGQLVSTRIHGPDAFVDYDAAKKSALVYDSPPPRAEAPPGDDELWWMNPLRTVEAYRGQPGVTVTEWQERSLWGGKVNVIDMTLPADGGKTEKRRWETDPATGRLLSEKVWRATDGDWKLVRETEDVQWEELPDSTWEFVPPKGTKVTYHRWWQARIGEPIASGESEHWRIVLYAVDADKQGNLLLTLSRWPTAEFAGTPLGVHNWNGSEPVAVEAADNLGVTYHHDNVYACVRDYWRTILLRSESPIVPGHARTVTLTVHPYSADGYEDETITFADVPIPPLQQTVGWETGRETEVVQY